MFSTYNLSEIEKDTFANYLQHVMNNPVLEFVRYMLGDDYLKFIDIMSGTTFKVPSSKSLERDLESVRVFLTVKKNGFTNESIKTASKMYGKTLLTTRRYVYRVCKTLGVEDTLEGDDLNNYIVNIKNIEEGIPTEELREQAQDSIVDTDDLDSWVTGEDSEDLFRHEDNFSEEDTYYYSEDYDDR